MSANAKPARYVTGCPVAGNDRTNLCQRGERWCERDALCRDGLERLSLALIRFIGAGYLTGSADCWEAAHARADDILGPADGPAFVAPAAALVRALRRERVSELEFFPACCRRMSSDEEQLMTLIHAARDGDVAAMEIVSARIMGNGSTTRVVLAARALAALMIRYVTLREIERKPSAVTSRRVKLRQ